MAARLQNQDQYHRKDRCGNRNEHGSLVSAKLRLSNHGLATDMNDSNHSAGITAFVKLSKQIQLPMKDPTCTYPLPGESHRVCSCVISARYWEMHC
jgi:hypothetical protein